VFGVSITELTLIAIVTLLAVGPHKLPTMLATFGRWMNKLRRMAHDMRQQTGIDELLREEGLRGGLNELRGLLRGGGIQNLQSLAGSGPRSVQRVERPNLDPSREYPPEGPDSYGALPDDLLRSEPVEDLQAQPGEPGLGAATPAPEAEPTP
jgi:sec-independent protein translocase protein TatB